MKSLIIYFSQCGSVMRVAQAISTGLQDAGYEITLWNIQDGQPPDVFNYDLLGIGSPTYYFRPPFNLIDYVNSLPNLAGLPIFVFVLYGSVIGDTGNIIRLALSLKDAKEVGYFKCHGAAYFLGYLKVGYLLSPDHPSIEDLNHAWYFGHKVSDMVSGNKYMKPDKDPSLPVMYKMERFLVNRTMVKHIYSRLFRVNSRCRFDCDICIKQCPVLNIARDKDGRIKWNYDCILCLSCEKNCPEDAITSPVTWLIFRPFMIYNTRKASRNLSYARVIHRKGQTTHDSQFV